MARHVQVLPNRKYGVGNIAQQETMCVCIKNDKKMTLLSSKHRLEEGEANLERYGPNQIT